MEQLRRFLRLLVVGALALGSLAGQDAPPNFVGDVLPIFAANCLTCHAEAAQSGLDLRTQDSILRGGASGPAVAPGNSAESLLIIKVAAGQMPPGPAQLAAAQVEILTKWIDQTLAAEETVPVAVAGL